MKKNCVKMPYLRSCKKSCNTMHLVLCSREIVMSVLSWAGEQKCIIKLMIVKTGLIAALSNQKT